MTSVISETWQACEFTLFIYEEKREARATRINKKDYRDARVCVIANLFIEKTHSNIIGTYSAESMIDYSLIVLPGLVNFRFSRHLSAITSDFSR